MAMSEEQFEQTESVLREGARAFPYPPTPDIAVAHHNRLMPVPHQARKRWRRLALAIAIVALLLAGLLAVPQVRAGILDMLRLGAVRIVLTEPTSTPAITPAPAATALPAIAPAPLTATPHPSPTALSSVLDLAGEVSLSYAQSRVLFPLKRPSYPSGLGAPDLVFLQRMNGPVVVLVWLDKTASPPRPRLSLHLLGPGAFANKVQPKLIQETSVNGQRALWTEGPYMIQQRDGDYAIRRLIDGHVLIWTEGEITYRLETDAPLDEAVKMAESLQ